MPANPGYSKIAITAAKAMAADATTRVAVFLPGGPGNGPVLYRESDSPAAAPDFDRLRDHGVPYVYVQSSDLRKCESFLESRLTDVLRDPAVAPDEKARIVHQVGAAVARDLTQGPITPEGMARASHVVDNVIAGVLNDPVVAGYMLHMAGHERTTASHMFVVSALAVVLGAEAFGADHEILGDLGLAGMMHDLGKLAISPEILNKTTPLTAEETQLIHQHPVESVRMLGDDPKVTPVIRQMILQHHEWIDGRGYPVGVSAEEILPGSRILTIVDSFHAMIGRRSYREPLTPHDANRALLAQAGRQFDADLLACWTQLFDRCWPRVEPVVAAPFGGVSDELSPRHEHRAVQPPRRFYGSRARRFACNGRVKVRCVYASRLPGATPAPDSFAADVQDISRSGLCLYTKYPVYRGEVMNVQIQNATEVTWVRGTVAWCRKHSSGRYRSGLRFLKKLAADEVDDSSDLQSAARLSDTAELAPSPDDAVSSKPRGGPPAVAAPGSHVADTEPKPGQSARVERGGAEELGVLATLAKTLDPRRVSSADERTVLALSESSDAEVRKRSVDLLTRIASKAARVGLIRLLKDGDAGVREQATLAAGVLQMAEASYALIRLLEDPEPVVAVRAASALGRLGDNTGLTVVAQYLVGDGPLARLAARALGEIVGHRFPANAEGIKAARRYLAAKGEKIGAA